MSKPDAIANDPDASRIWDELLSQVKAAGTWEDKFEPMFAVLVNSIVAYWAVTRRLAELRAKNPAMGEMCVNAARNTIYRNPWMDEQQRHINNIRNFGNAFGLSPLADAKLKDPGGSLEGGIGGLFKFLKGEEY